MINPTVSLVILSIAVNSIYGYFDVVLTEGRPIEGSLMKFDNLKVRRINHTTYAGIGSFDTLTEMDNGFDCAISFSKKQGNEYKLTPYHLGPYKFCDYFYNHSMVYDDLLLCSDMPPHGVCPWPKGTYNLDKCTIPMDKIPKFFDGDFRSDFKVFKGDEMVGGYQIFFSVTQF